MSIPRSIAAVEPLANDHSAFLVFCDDGSVWRWIAPEARARLGSEGWERLEPDLPQSSSS